MPVLFCPFRLECLDITNMGGIKMEECKIENLYNLEETIAKNLLEGLTYPWEALPKISEFILEIGSKLDPETYELKGENIWIAKSAKVMPSASSHLDRIHRIGHRSRPRYSTRGHCSDA